MVTLLSVQLSLIMIERLYVENWQLIKRGGEIKRKYNLNKYTYKLVINICIQYSQYFHDVTKNNKLVIYCRTKPLMEVDDGWMNEFFKHRVGNFILSKFGGNNVIPPILIDHK